MIMLMINKKSNFTTILIIFLLFFSIFTISISANENKKMQIENLDFSQEIKIDISSELQGQAIDKKVVFEKSCWAVDEKNHSIHIAMDDGRELTELELQIYNLDYSDNHHITSCNIVFLIPDELTGSEKFYIYYDSSEVSSPQYEDHLTLEDTHYFYEPISGQKIDFDYYCIKQEDNIIYALIQTGELLGNPVGLNIAKFKPNSKVVETYNIDQLAGFDFRYGTTSSPGYYGTSWAETVNKQVLVDGNLMIRIRLEGLSPDGALRTDNVYTYYYSPSSTKRIWVNTFHEVLEEVDIPDPSFYDGAYAGIVSIKTRSATIEKMNVGEILPEMNIYTEYETVESYSIPQNPSSEVKEAVLSTESDIDLGSEAWVSLCDSSTGKAHGLIMHSNENIHPTMDGVQIKAWVKQNVKLPGLEADTGSVFLLRNAYENSKHETFLKKDFKVNYDIEFISIEDEGFEKIQSEAKIFQDLIKTRPIVNDEQIIEEPEEQERYSLTTYVHNAPSFPMGSLLSAAIGKNIPYIYAELYKENSFKSSGSVARLPIGSIELDMEGKKFFEKVKTVINIFDWRNASIFKKIIFPDLTPGTYLVRIYRENPIILDQSQYIGYSIVDVSANAKTHIYCKAQATVNISVADQNKNPLNDVKVTLEQKNAIIYEVTTDNTGFSELYAPTNLFKDYTLKIYYQGFLVKEKPIRLGIKSRFISSKETINVETYSLTVSVTDSWGLSPEVELNPIISSPSMYKETTLKAEKTNPRTYVFNDIYPADYDLLLRYKSFKLEEKIKITNDEAIELAFPAEYTVDLKVYNKYGNEKNNGIVQVSRKNLVPKSNFDDEAQVNSILADKNLEVKINEQGVAKISVPPAKYNLKIFADDELIAAQDLEVFSDKNVEIVTKEDSTMHNIALFAGLIIIAFAFVLIFYKKKINFGLKILVLGIILISLFSPWWTMHGENESYETTTNVLLIPGKIVTLTQGSESIGGEISMVPDEVTMVLGLLFMLLLIASLLIILSTIIEKRFRKTSIVLSVLSLVVLLCIIGIFIYAMSILTEVGVGSFIGSGNIDTTISGQVESQLINCNWGPGIGLLLLFVSFVLVLFSLIKQPISKKLRKN